MSKKGAINLIPINMDFDLDKLEDQALSLLRDACTSYGIRASPEEQENYRRLWARDSMIAGIAGLLAGDEQVIRGLRDSILTLANYQHARGMIPSNVLPDETDPNISYGTLAGRVDANTWFMIGSCLYLLNSPDASLQKKLKPSLNRVLELLDRWEFNAGDLLYTPLGGNWADEYPVQGHTLYDNLLRLWSLQLYGKLFEDEKRQQHAEQIRRKININFWPDATNRDHPDIYHPRCFTEAAKNRPQYFSCAIDPSGYNQHFDTAGHGMALMLGLTSREQQKEIFEHIEDIFTQISTELLPAFWPVITSDDLLWEALKNNYNYSFKNHPHHYHNGGIWPVWMGWLALGAGMSGASDLPETMLDAWMDIENLEEISFCEYISSDTLTKSGKKRLCYSASGLIFLISAIRKKSLGKLHIE